MLSSYVVGRIVKGIVDLKDLQAKCRKDQVEVPYKGAWIKRLMLSTATKYYEMGLKIFLGDCLVRFFEDYQGENPMAALRENLKHHAGMAMEDWVDISGLLAPSHRVRDLVAQIEDGTLTTVDEILAAVESISATYAADEWNWLCALMNSDEQELTDDKILRIIEDWKASRIKLNNMILQDAGKEFDNTAQIGFGIDGAAEERSRDFEAVRGTRDGNSFIRDIQEQTTKIEQTAESLLSRLREQPLATV